MTTALATALGFGSPEYEAAAAPGRALVAEWAERFAEFGFAIYAMVLDDIGGGYDFGPHVRVAGYHATGKYGLMIRDATPAKMAEVMEWVERECQKIGIERMEPTLTAEILGEWKRREALTAPAPVDPMLAPQVFEELVPPRPAP